MLALACVADRRPLAITFTPIFTATLTATPTPPPSPPSLTLTIFSLTHFWQVRAALLVFTPSPQDYITQLGEQLLSLPQQLEAHAASETLSLLHPSLRPLPEHQLEHQLEEEGAMAWLHAVAHATAGALLEAVASIPAFSPLGAQQLAADVGYLANILSGGLGLRPLPQLAQLETLLACAPSELPAKVHASTALPSALAAAIASKRGVHQLS